MIGFCHETVSNNGTALFYFLLCASCVLRSAHSGHLSTICRLRCTTSVLFQFIMPPGVRSLAIYLQGRRTRYGHYGIDRTTICPKYP